MWVASNLFNTPPSLKINSSVVAGVAAKAVAPVIVETSNPASAPQLISVPSDFKTCVLLPTVKAAGLPELSP